MNFEEFKKYTAETLDKVYSKLNKEEKIFISDLVTAFNQKCDECLILHQALLEVKDKLLCYGETFDSNMHKKFQNNCLQVIDKALGSDK